MNTNTKNYILATGSIIALVVGFAFFALSLNQQPATASIGTYESYNSRTVSSTDASGSVSVLLCKDNCQLGSIIVNQVGTTGYVRVWNATSTATSTYATTDTATTSSVTVGKPIAKILTASDAATTLTYDTILNKGLVVEVSTGFDGEYTITYKR